MRLAEGWMLPHASKSTACSLPRLNKEPLQCWAGTAGKNTRGSKHLKSNWSLLHRLQVLHNLHQEDLKVPSCRWFKDTTCRCSKKTFPAMLQAEQKSEAVQGTTAWLCTATQNRVRQQGQQ